MMNKMMKKMAIAFAVAAMTITGTSAVCFAAAPAATASQSMSFSVQPESGTYYVNNDEGVNVRVLPCKDAARIGGLYRCDQVTVTGRVYENGAEDGWMQINYNGQTGYIRNCLSSTKPAPLPTPSPAPSNNGVNPQYTWIKETNSSHSSQVQQERGQMSHDNDTFTACVSSGYLALRSAPATDPSNEIGQIQNGQMVQVQNYGSQFDYVYVPATGQYGYVNNDYLG